MRKMLWLSLLLVALLGCGGGTNEQPTVVAENSPLTPAATAGPPTTLAPRQTLTWLTATATGETPPLPTTPPPPPAGPATPVVPSPVPPPATVDGGATCNRPPDWPLHVVTPGQTLGQLAACAGSSVAELAAANCLSSADLIFAGQTLALPRACLPPPSSPEPPPPTATSGPGEGGSNVTPPSPPTMVRPTAPGPGGGVTISISPTAGAPGTAVTLSFTGFNERGFVVLRVLDALTNNVVYANNYRADDAGRLTVTYSVPATFPPGWLLFVGFDPGDIDREAQELFEVTGPTWTPTATSTTPPTPTAEPTATDAPTAEPTATDAPTAEPAPTDAPTPEPTAELAPTDTPTTEP